MTEWVLHFDGLFEPRFSDNGLATYGFTVDRDGARIGEGHGLVAGPGGPLASAIVSEFGALIEGLSWLRAHKRDAEPVVVRGDNRLVIESVAGRWNLHKDHLLPLRDAARSIAADVGVTRYEKVSREQNADADALSRLAYHELTAANPAWGLGQWSKSRQKSPTRAPPRL